MNETIYVCILIGLIFATKHLLRLAEVKRRRYCRKCIIEVGDDVEICPKCGQSYYIVIVNPDGTTSQWSFFVGEKTSSVVIIFCMIGFAMLAWYLLFAFN